MTAIGVETGLIEQAFLPLPLGGVRPAGWLREQLLIQAKGLSGHLDEFWPDIAQSGWIGGEAEGWERGPYWLDGLVPLAFLLDDPELKDKVQRWMDYILAHQQEDGWLGATYDKRVSNLRDLRPGRPTHSHEYDPWPRFVLLKAMIQYYEGSADERIIPSIRRFLPRLNALLDDRVLRSWGRFRWADLVLSVHWLYERSGEPWLLKLASKLHDQGFDWRMHFERFSVRDKCLREERDLTTHVVNNAMGIKAPAVWYRQSGDAGDRDAALHIIEQLDAYHGQASGVFSGDEHLAGRSPSQGTELCAVVEYMFSLEVLLSILGIPSLADQLERITYNALPAPFGPDMWTHQYVQQVNQAVCRVAEDRVYTSNGSDANIFGLEPNFGCCTADMHQGWPKFVSRLWMATPDDGLAAVAYGPCIVDAEVMGAPVRIEVDTEYPFDGALAITVRAQRPIRFPLYLRIPIWGKGSELRVDGVTGAPPEPGTFHRVEREWTDSTTLTLTLPMQARVEKRDNGSVSIYRGPLLFGLHIEEDWRRIGGDEPHADWEVHPLTPWNYALEVDMANPGATVRFERHPVSSAPFSPGGAPVTATVVGRRVPEWRLEHSAAGPVPASPMTSSEPRQELRLVPFGASSLRIAQFPVVDTRASAAAGPSG